VVARSLERRVDCADIPVCGRVTPIQEITLGQFESPDRRRVAVAVTSDGRRVQLPVTDNLVVATLFEILRSLLVGLDGLLGLITGSRRENGGTRRDRRG
jgi:hypothetical protein